MKKRISHNPAEQTPFERFYLEFPRLLEKAGGVSYGENGLSEIGWTQRAAQLLFEAMGEPDMRGTPAPPESHGGDWIGYIVEDKPDEWTLAIPASTYCTACGLLQFGTTSGMTCSNGHGGDPGEPGEVHMWYHPESGSLFTTEPGEEFPKDGLVEHLDADSYEKIKARVALMERYAMDPVEGGADEADFEL